MNIFAGCLLQIHRGHSHTSLNGNMHRWRRLQHLEELGEATATCSPWAPTTALAPQLAKSCSLTALCSCWGAWQQTKSQQFGKSCPGSECTWPTGTTIGKRKDRYINTTATKKNQSVSYLRNIFTSPAEWNSVGNFLADTLKSASLLWNSKFVQVFMLSTF